MNQHIKKVYVPMTETAFYILLCLKQPNHGYGVVQQVEQMTGGRLILGPGTLYGALNQLTEKGWIELYSQQTTSRKKKEYVITSQGREAFAKEVERLEEMLRNSALMEEDAQ